MADFLEHLWQAKHNQQFATSTLTTRPDFRDWAITSAFYSALHYAEACFSTRRDIPTPNIDENLHAFRLQLIKYEAPRAQGPYRRLQNACWDVRYMTTRIRWTEIYTVEKARELVTGDLPRCREELERAFGVNLA